LDYYKIPYELDDCKVTTEGVSIYSYYVCAAAVLEFFTKLGINCYAIQPKPGHFTLLEGKGGVRLE